MDATMIRSIITEPEVGDAELPLLNVCDVRKEYVVTSGMFQQNKQSLRALDRANLQLFRGRTMGVVGESGCGKTTLAKLLVMLETPTAGHIFFEGKDIFGLQGKDIKAYRQKVQLVFQDPYSSLPAHVDRHGTERAAGHPRHRIRGPAASARGRDVGAGRSEPDRSSALPSPVQRRATPAYLCGQGVDARAETPDPR